MESVAAIIQARMGSSRLPNKVMKSICGKTVLEHVIERVGQCKEIDDIIIATTTFDRDNVIADEALRCGVKYFRGSEDDVLSRYYYAAEEYKADIIVRITSDCPLIDPAISDNVIKFYRNNKYDIVTNAGIDLSQRTYPRGLDTEVFSFKVLEAAFKNATKGYQREHVTPYIYENCKKAYYKNPIDFSRYRWTLDTDDDLKLIDSVYKYLYKGKHNFYFNDIIELMDKHPELAKINEHVEQKKIEGK
jgi:spore coat polysaccharide biosynthesis protein SpsF